MAANLGKSSERRRRFGAPLIAAITLPVIAAGVGAYVPAADARGGGAGWRGGGGVRMWSRSVPIYPYAYPPQFQYYVPPSGYSYYPYNVPVPVYPTQPNYPTNPYVAQPAPSYSPAPSVTTAPSGDGFPSGELLEHVVIHAGTERVKEFIKTSKREVVPAGAATLTEEEVASAAAGDAEAEGFFASGAVIEGTELLGAIADAAEIGLTFYLIYEIWRWYQQSEVIIVPFYVSRRRYYATQTFTYQMTEAVIT